MNLGLSSLIHLPETHPRYSVQTAVLSETTWILVILGSHVLQPVGLVKAEQFLVKSLWTLWHDVENAGVSFC